MIPVTLLNDKIKVFKKTANTGLGVKTQALPIEEHWHIEPSEKIVTTKKFDEIQSDYVGITDSSIIDLEDEIEYDNKRCRCIFIYRANARGLLHHVEAEFKLM